MEREQFLKAYEAASTVLDEETMKKNAAFLRSVDPDIAGSSNIIVAIEECAELIQELCKHLRGKGDRLHLIEELADCQLGMEYVKSATGITNEEINKAKNVKTDRQLVRNNNYLKLQQALDENAAELALEEKLKEDQNS